MQRRPRALAQAIAADAADLDRAARRIVETALAQGSNDNLTVQIVRVDMERRQIDLGLTDILDAVRQSEGARGPRRSAARPKEKPNQKARKVGRPGRRERTFKKATKRRR